VKKVPRYRSIVFVLAGLGASCAGTSEKDSLQEVDNLVAHIERVHVESELARERVRGIVGKDFAGDPVQAYGEFVAAVEASEEQVEILRDCIGPMKSSADSVFGQWEKDIDVFTNPGMRARSAERLQQTRGRYDEIVARVDPASETLVVFNQSLRDHVLFLEHDFNPAAVRALSVEVNALTQNAKLLDRDLQKCLTATLAYVRSTALPGELEVAQAKKSAAP